MKNVQTIKQTATIAELSNEKLLAKRDELKQLQQDVEANIKAVDSELFTRCDKETERAFQVGERRVQIVTRANYKEVSLSYARRHDAVKEVVDTTILGALYKRGDKIPGILFSEYVYVK